MSDWRFKKQQRAQERRRERQAVMERFRLVTEAQAGRRPMRGTGTSGTDLFRFERSGWCESVEDERKGRLFCRDCGAEIQHVETPKGWQARNPDGIPHALTCGEE